MATRTLLKGYIKQGDNTYAEHEIHPYTDMESVVSLNNVGTGNYSSYSGLPLEGGPENVLTSFLKTRSYLKSLEAFTGKKITDSTTDTTDQSNKIPSLKALQDVKSTTENNISQLQSATTVAQGTANDALRTANAAKTTADNAIPKSDINGNYTSNTSASQVLSMQGANNLYNYAKGAKTTADNAIPQSNIRTDYKNISQTEANSTVLSMMGARELYLTDKDIYKNLLASYIFSLSSRNDLCPIQRDTQGFVLSPTCGIDQMWVCSAKNSALYEDLSFKLGNKFYAIYKITIFGFTPTNTKDSTLTKLKTLLASSNTNSICRGQISSVYTGNEKPTSGLYDGIKGCIISYNNEPDKNPIAPSVELIAGIKVTKTGENITSDFVKICEYSHCDSGSSPHVTLSKIDNENSGSGGKPEYIGTDFYINTENFPVVVEAVNPHNPFIQSLLYKLY